MPRHADLNKKQQLPVDATNDTSLRQSVRPSVRFQRFFSNTYLIYTLLDDSSSTRIQQLASSRPRSESITDRPADGRTDTPSYRVAELSIQCRQSKPRVEWWRMAECLGSLFLGDFSIVSRISGAPRLNRGLKYEPKPLPHWEVGPKMARNGQK